MAFTLTFFQIFSWGIYLIAPLLMMFFLAIMILALIAGRIESWNKFDALYWGFITALTVGYGDIRPVKKTTKSLSVVIAAFGIMFSGMLVAITIEASTRAFKIHMDPEGMRVIEARIG